MKYEDIKNKIEILAPAGSEEVLRAAVFAGADAVYLGGVSFGARAKAKNFSNDELSDAVRFCRIRGVKIYVTVNTLIKDTEMAAALDFVRFLASLSIDAVLVQDMGLFSFLRECAPDLPLHASTQTSIHTPAGARFFEEFGAQRVVIARELSLSEIKEISEKSNIELEAFVHGALCMSVSGQCYMSSALGGRSGNRGACAQPCRLPFAANGGTGFDLSLKDLSFVEQIDNLKKAGVCSAKIEGRLKRPEYAAAAVSACRKAADNEDIPQDLLEDLEAVFSRSGFTKGYLLGKTGSEMFGTRTKQDVTGAGESVFSKLRQLCRSERQDISVDFELFCDENNRINIKVSDDNGNIAADIQADMFEVSNLTRERCIEQLSKTGGTPFFVRNADVPEQGVAMPISAFNAARRRVLDKLSEMRACKSPIEFENFSYEYDKHEALGKTDLCGVKLHASFKSTGQLCKQAKSLDAVYLPLFSKEKSSFEYIEELKNLKNSGFSRIILKIPRAAFGEEERIKVAVNEFDKVGFSEFICGNLGAVQLCREMGVKIHGGFSLNIANTAAINFFEKLGLVSAEISFELAKNEILRLGGKLERGIMLYGRQPLMLVRNCPLANSKRGCLGCEKPEYLTDRLGKKFPVMCEKSGKGKSVEVFNSVPVALYDKKDAVKNADFGVIRFTVENSVECGEKIEEIIRQEKPQYDYTRGAFYRGVE